MANLQSQHEISSETVKLMRLFGENVKKDILCSDSVLKLVQDKLKQCDINMNDLKKMTNELNNDFNKMKSQVHMVDVSLKRLNSISSNSTPSSSVSRSDSLLNLSDEFNEFDDFNATLKFDHTIEQQTESDLEDEKNYVYISRTPHGTVVEEENFAFRKSQFVNSDETNSSGFASDEEREYEKVYVDKLLHESCNELIKMLITSSFSSK